MVLHRRTGNVVVISTYWLLGDGILGANTERVRSLSSFVLTLADPWVILADFNMTPEEMLATGWPERVGGCIVTPRNVSATCDQGRGRMLDYAVVYTRAAHRLQVQVNATLEVPWATHCALEITLRLCGQPRFLQSNHVRLDRA